jgi:hyperosmotically inducible periplasmic protein
MTRLTILFLCLLVATTSFAGQGSTESPAKSKAKSKTVDCTTVDDAKITSDVKAKFAKSTSLKDFTVNVATREGEVTITGTVKTGLQKGSATRMAKAVACVRKVVNQLTVEGTNSKGSGK